MGNPMNSDSAWYVAAQGGASSGPFTAKQIIDDILAGQADPTLLCWREGMPEWLPLTQVEPFASAVGSAIPAPPPPPIQHLSQHPEEADVPVVAAPRRARTARESSGVATGFAIAGLVVAIPS